MRLAGQNVRSFFNPKRSKTETRTEKLDLRLTPSAKRTLQMAASAQHRSVSEFVLEKRARSGGGNFARPATLRLSTDRWKAFQAALAAAPRPSRRLAKLMKDPSVFERGGV